MIRRGLTGRGGVRRHRRTKKVYKSREDLSVDDKENDCTKSVSDKGLANSLDAPTGVNSVDEIFHDLNLSRHYDVNRRDNGFKVSDTIRVDKNKDCIKFNFEPIADETTKLDGKSIKHSNESENLDRELQDLSTIRTSSQGCSRVIKENETRSEVGTSGHYIPSWFNDISGDSLMDLNTIRHLGIVPKGLSMSLTDLKPEARDPIAHSRDLLPQQQPHSQQHEMADGKKHEKMEKEYLRLKKKLTSRQKTDLNSSDLSSKKAELINKNARANLSDTLIPRCKEFFESDELGINHFQKHIHNVKVSSKKHKRALKLMEAAASRVGPMHSKKRPVNFKPLYEQKYSEDVAPATGAKHKTGSIRS